MCFAIATRQEKNQPGLSTLSVNQRRATSSDADRQTYRGGLGKEDSGGPKGVANTATAVREVSTKTQKKKKLE